MKINLIEDDRTLDSFTIAHILDEHTINNAFKIRYYMKKDEDNNVIDVLPTFAEGFEKVEKTFEVSKYQPFVIPFLGRYLSISSAKLGNFIADFCEQNADALARMYCSLQYHYNPLNNYDRHEVYDETNNIKYKGKESDTLTMSGSETNKMTPSGTNKTITENEVTGYNDADDYHKDNKSTATNSYQNYNEETKTTFDNRQNKNDHTFDNREDDGSRKANNYLYGNIGVTSSVDLINQDLQLAQRNVLQDMFYYIIKDISFVA